MNPRYREIGIGIATGMYEGRHVLMAVQHFGLPRSACPTVNNTLSTRFESLRFDLQSLEKTLKDLKALIENNTTPAVEKEASVREYNGLISVYNNKVIEIEKVIESYNGQVRSFNDCAVQ